MRIRVACVRHNILTESAPALQSPSPHLDPLECLPACELWHRAWVVHGEEARRNPHVTSMVSCGVDDLRHTWEAAGALIHGGVVKHGGMHRQTVQLM